MPILALTLTPGTTTGLIGHIAGPEAGGIWAVWDGGNPLSGAGASPATAAAPRIALWSGSMASWDDEPEGLAAPDPRTWGVDAWQRFEAVCSTLAAGPAAHICFRTHASHVLSDVPSCGRFLRGSGGGAGRLSLLVDPAAMLAGTMIGSAPDHIERILASLGGQPGVAGVVLTNLNEGLEPGGAMPASPLHRGVVDPVQIVDLVRRYVPPQTPLIVLEEELDAQLRLLAGLGGGS